MKNFYLKLFLVFMFVIGCGGGIGSGPNGFMVENTSGGKSSVNSSTKPEEQPPYETVASALSAIEVAPAGVNLDSMLIGPIQTTNAILNDAGFEVRNPPATVETIENLVQEIVIGMKPIDTPIDLAPIQETTAPVASTEEVRQVIEQTVRPITQEQAIGNIVRDIVSTNNPITIETLTGAANQVISQQVNQQTTIEQKIEEIKNTGIISTSTSSSSVSTTSTSTSIASSSSVSTTSTSNSIASSSGISTTSTSSSSVSVGTLTPQTIVQNPIETAINTIQQTITTNTVLAFGGGESVNDGKMISTDKVVNEENDDDSVASQTNSSVADIVATSTSTSTVASNSSTGTATNPSNSSSTTNSSTNTASSTATATQVTETSVVIEEPKEDEPVTSVVDCKKFILGTFDTLGNPRWVKTALRNGTSLETYWANQALIVNMNNSCNEGFYNLYITAKNTKGPLAPNYKNFSMVIDSLSMSNKMLTRRESFLIPASDTSWKNGVITVYLKKGENKFRLIWTNDQHTPGRYDTNIQILKASFLYRGDLVTEGKHIPCPDLRTSLDTSAGQWYQTSPDSSKNQRGIETYWARQNLKLQITGNCRAGYYGINVVAKNIRGSLPRDYKFFNVLVQNETTSLGEDGKKTVGLIQIPADVDRYRSAGTRIWLRQGDNTINLKWINDAYKPNEYDANIQIRAIGLDFVTQTFVQDPFLRTGIQFCDAAPNGSDYRWYWSQNSVYTYWANQYIDYCMNVPIGRYKVVITAKNLFTGVELPLPPNYPSFKVKATIGVNDIIVDIPANKDSYKSGWNYITVSKPSDKIRLLWLNDAAKANQYDANIQINAIKLIPVQ